MKFMEMKSLISIRLAGNIIITINTLAILMHAMILLKVLPYNFVWGGRLKGEGDVILFESISLGVQALFIAVIAAKAGYAFKGKLRRTVNFGTWVMFGLMVLNTIGNFASSSGLEAMIMTPLTGVLAVLVFRLAIEK
ncbi:hypothetical protein RAC89_26555 [Paenibacillus sp. GD4]|uniref:hypothetical protein n=1 Tax=Paenibacillus sp. GD4 TaxID=3068890 RepID=UPI0027965CBE|nr:hypothetical protein [Paenibacillus sp. GD4]MDQ1913968.1 hypothetical protein [Paenibacillus sp. GD4]